MVTGEATATPTPAPLLVDLPAAAALLSISPSHLDNMNRDGRFGPMPRRLGRSVRWCVREVQDWLDAGCPPRHKWQAIRDERPVRRSRNGLARFAGSR